MNFLQSAAQSFGPAFSQSFAKGQDAALKRQEEERLLKMQQEADQKLLESFKEVESQEQDRIGGVQTLAEIRTSANLTPAARKALVKGKIKRMESQGIKLTPEFHEWLTSAKPDEMNAVLDVIFEKSQSDPNFGQQQFIDIISDPEKFTQVLSQASTQANQTLSEEGETGTSPAKQNAMLKNISSEMTKAQAEVNRLQKQRNAMVEAMARNPNASKGALKAMELRIKQIDNKMNDANDRMQKLDQRAFDLETKDKRTLRKFIGPQGERNIFEMNDGTFTDLEGNPIDVSQGMVTTLGAKPGQEMGIEVGPDGTVRFVQGPEGTLTKSQQGQQQIEFEDQQIAARNFIDLSDKIIDSIEQTPASMGVTGWVSRMGGELKGIVNNVQTLFPNTKIEASLDPNDYDWGSLAGESAEFKANMMDLALMYIMGSALGKGGRVSDKDVDRAIEAIGASTNDPRQLIARLAAMQDNMLNNLKNTAEVKGKAFKEIKRKDRTKKEDAESVLKEADEILGL